jgi:hypothetical protein
LVQSLAFDDNIYASDRVQVSDFVSTTSEALTAHSQWARDSLAGRAYFAQQVYGTHSIQDANTFGVEAAGRWDISADSFFRLEAGFVQQPQKRNSPQAAVAFTQRPIYNNVSSTATYQQSWDRLQNRLQVELVKNAYTTRANFSRNGTDLRYSDRLSTALTGSMWAFVQGSYSTHNWLLRGDRRNFNTLIGLVGITDQITDLVEVEIGVGVLRQQFRNDAFDTLVTPTFSGKLTWNPLPLTSITLSADRTVGGLETFCDGSLSGFTCEGLKGASVQQLVNTVNGYLECAPGLCATDPAKYYAGLAKDLSREYYYRLFYHQPVEDIADLYPSLPRGTLSVAEALTVLQEINKLLARQAAGVPIFGDQRGTIETITAQFGVQHEFWHNLLGEIRFRFEEDRFNPVGLVNRNYEVNVNGRFLVNRNMELDLSYVHNIRDANLDLILYNSGPYTENAVSLTLKLAL